MKKNLKINASEPAKKGTDRSKHVIEISFVLNKDATTFLKDITKAINKLESATTPKKVSK